LLVLGDPLFEGGAQAVGEDGHAALVLFRLQPHVEDADQRQGLAVGALEQADELVFAVEGVLKRLERRSGGAEDDGAAFEVGAQHGDIAAVVAGDLVLLVGVLVFLIDQDQPEVRQRREDRGAGADDDAGDAFADAVPLVEALALGEVRVEHGDLFLDAGEAGAEAADGLGC